MRKYYTVFDRDRNRVGFALANHGQPAGRLHVANGSAPRAAPADANTDAAVPHAPGRTADSVEARDDEQPADQPAAEPPVDAATEVAARPAMSVAQLAAPSAAGGGGGGWRASTQRTMQHAWLGYPAQLIEPNPW